MIREDKELVQKFLDYTKKIDESFKDIYSIFVTIKPNKNRILEILKDDKELAELAEEAYNIIEDAVGNFPGSALFEDLDLLGRSKLVDEYTGD